MTVLLTVNKYSRKYRRKCKYFWFREMCDIFYIK